MSDSHEIESRIFDEWVAFKQAQQVERDAEAKLTGLLKIKTTGEAYIAALQSCGKAVYATRTARDTFFAAALKMVADDRAAEQSTAA